MEILDKIQIEDATYKCKLGVTAEERAYPQKIQVCADLYFDIKKSGETKNLEDGLCWSNFDKFLASEISKCEYVLVEELIEKLAENIFLQFSVIQKINLKIKKFGITNCKWVAVEICRSRG